MQGGTPVKSIVKTDSGTGVLPDRDRSELLPRLLPGNPLLI